jgi:hypothetical protein
MQNQIKKTIKKVTFSNIVSLHLIPSRQELIDANLLDDLWWDKQDCSRFYLESLVEMKELKEKHPDIKRNEILKLLYQPGNISYNESNF